VLFDGVEMTELSDEDLRHTRTQMQMIFQDPISSLNPRRKVRDIVAEGLDIWKLSDNSSNAVDTVLEDVGLDPTIVGSRRPHEFSGGQCQRICVARALVMDPKIIICDEPVSALDVSVQAQILNLLEAMKVRYGLTMIFIAHDLAVVKNISDRVVVMYLGKICEVAPPDAIFARPRHPYTDLLVKSIPVPDPRRGRSERRITGELPSPINPPSGCRFRTRCPRATERCELEEPTLEATGDGHYVACHHPVD
jgi:peptide/nickel transport system ATP-binding protein